MRLKKLRNDLKMIRKLYEIENIKIFEILSQLLIYYIL